MVLESCLCDRDCGRVLLVAAGPAAGAGGLAGGAAATARRATVLPPPTISSFTPTSGVPGTTVTINGSLLYPATVEFNGTAATITANTATQVKALVPAGATTGKIILTTPGGATMSPGNFTVKTPPQPSLNSFTPASGVPGATVTISGTALLGATRVAFNNTTAQVSSNSNTAIKALVPAGATTGKVTVTTVGGTATSAAGFAVKTLAQPKITSFTPTSGVPGTAVTVKGSNLLGATRVAFNAAAAEISSNTNSAIKALVPAGATKGQISVATAGGTVNSASDFSPKAPLQPAISSFTPTSGVPGTTVTIKGTNLLGATRVAFNGATAQIASDTAPQIKALLPVGATTGKITVTTAGGTANSASSFRPKYEPDAAELHVSGTLSASDTWSPAKAGTYVLDGPVTVPSSVTLTVAPGTLIKALGGPSSGGLTVSGGTLVANGTAAAPVVFTSIHDPTPGGATDTTSAPSPGDWVGLRLTNGPRVTLTFTHVSYASSALEGGGGNPGAKANISLDHATFDHVANWTLDASWVDQATVTNSTFDGGYGINLGAAHLAMSGNSVATAAATTGDGGVYIQDLAEADQSMTVTGNTFTNAPLELTSYLTTTPRVQNNSFNGSYPSSSTCTSCPPLISVASDALDLGLLTSNTASNSLDHSFALAGTLTTTGSLASLPAGWTTILGWALQPRNTLIVPTGVTLTIPAGRVLKGRRRATGGGLTVSGGTLVANGTAAAPVVFTSIHDPTPGGATDTTSAPAAGDWPGITLSTSESSGKLTGTTLRFASTALTIADGAEAEIHGAVLDSSVGISGADSWVDATHVDWGDPSGPAPMGSGTSVQGRGVWVLPWVGFTTPPRPDPTDPPVDFDTCRSFFVIGARGQGQDPQGDPPIYSGKADGFGSEAYDAYWGFKEELEAHSYEDSDFELLGLRYRALGFPYNVVDRGTQAYFDSIWEGVNNLITAISDERRRCSRSSERIVLVGYSQGALAIHLALRILSRSDPQMVSSSTIAGVMLIADPAKTPHGDETTWEAENQQALPGSGIDDASGLWTNFVAAENGPLPAGVTGRTIAICHNHDIVCAPAVLLFPSSWRYHTNYGATELNALGRWLARRVLGLG